MQENTVKKASARRIGVFGGTFNPIHNRHIEIAERACSLFSLERVLLVVAKDPPHKEVKDGVSASMRLDMACLAANGVRCLQASDIELKRQGKSYTYDTLCQLAKEKPDCDALLILGDDMLFAIEGWYNAAELMKMAEIAVIPREANLNAAREEAARLGEAYGAKIHVLDVSVSGISSTMVRERVYNALPISSLVPVEVENYIYRTGLYQPRRIAGIIRAVEAALSASRFSHTLGVMKTAINLAHRYGVDTEKARLSALLHDYGRSAEKDPLRHCAESARLAREQFNVRDEEVLSAIARHTTLCKNSSALDRIIYLADIIEPSREFEGVNKIRALALRNLDEAVIMGLKETISYVRLRNRSVESASIEALEEIEKETAHNGIDNENKTYSQEEEANELELKEQVLALCEMLYGKKAEDIVAIHVADKTIIADWFIVCNGRSVTQVKALSDEIEDKAHGIGLTLRRRDGYQEGRWIVLDYASILVHIFIPDERQYYNMERLWMDDPSEAMVYPPEKGE